MLRIYECKNRDQAKSYYTEGLSREDYYSKGQEIPGQWRGIGADRLGLSGPVDKKAFHLLCENRDPSHGNQLTPRMSEKRRVGYDINFNAPKSLSIIHAIGGDTKILEAFQESVRETMELIEKNMQTRVRTGGESTDRQTSNMVWGEFVHLTARPVEGHPDPHLHCHCFAFNTTYDQEEDRWKAGQFGTIKKDAPYYEAVFHSRLSDKIREIGYDIERTEGGWEIRGIDQSILRAFSQRTDLIEKAARESGVSSKKSKGELGARTREKKSHELTSEELLNDWKDRLGEDGQICIEQVLNKSKPISERKYTAKEVLDWAISNQLERQSVVDYRRLLAEALKTGYGSVTLEALEKEAESRDFISSTIKGQKYVTTREVYEEELSMVQGVRDSRGTCLPLNSKDREFQNQNLSSEQKQAISHILKSTDRIVGIRGAAGTGKTTLMKEAVQGIEESGKKVFIFAPTSEASRGVLRQEGFKNADTVTQLLTDRRIAESARNQVIWIDEAGLLGSINLKKVLDLSEKVNARVVLSGDSRQHKSVDRGDSLRLLEEHAGLSCAELKTIYRQQGTYRDAIKELSNQNIGQGIEILSQMGAIMELDDDVRFKEIAKHYQELVSKGDTCLVVSPTRAEGAKVSEHIRDELRNKGILEPKDKERYLPTLRNLNLTTAQKEDAAKYQSGHVIQFMHNSTGIRKGEKLVVLGVKQGAEKDLVLVQNKRGQKLSLPLHQAERFQVYENGTLPVSPGEEIRFTQNGKSLDGHRLHNGSTQKVKAILRNGNIRLENGWEIAKDTNHIEHAYVSTSHGSQGKTVDHVIISQSSESFGRASSMEQFYVSASRGRKTISIFTDDREGLKDAVSLSNKRLSALELGHDSKSLQSFATELIRKKKYDMTITAKGDIATDSLDGRMMTNKDNSTDSEKPKTGNLTGKGLSVFQPKPINTPANTDRKSVTKSDIRQILQRHLGGKDSGNEKSGKLSEYGKEVLKRHGIVTNPETTAQKIVEKEREHGK